MRSVGQDPPQFKNRHLSRNPSEGTASDIPRARGLPTNLSFPHMAHDNAEVGH